MNPTRISMDHQTAVHLADLFESLSDPTRLKIIDSLLDGEVNVGDLVELIGLSKSAISHQLRGLKDKRVIRTRKLGRQVFIALDDEHISELFRRGLEHIQHA